MELENLQDKCGVFACVASDPSDNELNVANLISMGLVGLQHRGQESAGIVTSCGTDPLYHQRSLGLVSQIFNPENLEKLKGYLGIGHTRYSTIGAFERTICQPFVVESTYGQFSVAHNGEIVNNNELKKAILQKGVGLSSGTDSEIITQILCGTPDCGEPVQVNWVGRIKNMMQFTKLSFSLLILSKDTVYAVRDPYGNRPLCLGHLKSSDKPVISSAYFASSESGVFASIGAKFFREVLPGEIVEITKSGFKSMGIVPRERGNAALCIFEYIYFSRPDSYMEGQQVNAVRFRCGQKLAKEAFVEADLVSGVPESATAAALGYARESLIPYVEVLTRNRYIGRSFIQPTKYLRQLSIVKKFGFLTENFIGKRVILIDDSIVRGNTIVPLISVLKDFGAKEIHIRVASPPIRYPCFMGINIPTQSELIYNSVSSNEELAKLVGADSLEYLSVDGLHEVVSEGVDAVKTGNSASCYSNSGNIGSHCDACLTGKYPVKPPDF